MQLFTYTPSLTILNIRGVSQSNFQDNLEAPVAAYIDEAYISSMNMVGQQMFDMERVEVLRGPQGTLFGRNATGGVVQYVTRGATDDEFNGYVEASYAEYDRSTVEAAFGGALGSNVRARFASVNRGIKGGNWAVPTVADFRGPVDISDVIEHGEEVLWSYEVGGKFTLFNGTARLNTTAFYYDYNDYQVFSLIALQPDVLNSDATAYGGEIELALSPSENWDFNFGVALLGSKVDETPTVFGEFTVEGDLPQAPEISFNFLGRHTWLVPGGSMSVQLDGLVLR